MKKLFSFIVFITVMVLGSQVYAQKSMTALQMNDKLASVTDSLYARGQEWGQQFSTIITGSKDFKSLAKYRLNIEAFIDRKLVEIRNLKDVAGSKELRDAMMEFLQFEKHMIQAGFAPAEKLTANATEEQIQAVIKKLTDESANENTVLEKVRAAQQAYAEKNGFKIETEEAASGE